MNPLHNVFKIIETVVSMQDKGATYSDILAILNLPKSTVHRILKELTEIEYIAFNTETKRYYGSLRLARLGCRGYVEFPVAETYTAFSGRAPS